MGEGPQGRAAVGTAVAEDPASPGADGSGWAVCLDDLNRRVRKHLLQRQLERSRFVCCCCLCLFCC